MIAHVKTHRHMRFSLDSKQHEEARILRAQADLTNEELWIDMVRVYKSHPSEWSKR